MPANNLISARFRIQFLDFKSVQSAAERARLRTLAKAGKFVRTVARRSIRKRKAPSAPGSPPSSHVGTLRNLIFYAQDTGGPMVVGPVPFRRGTAPNRLEFGGTEIARRTRRVPSGEVGRDTAGRFTKRKSILLKKGSRLKYRQRPFMAPALKEALPVFPELWRNSIVSGG